MSSQRVKPIEPPYSELTQKSFDTIMPPGVDPLNIFRVVGNNERVLDRMVKGGLLDKGSVSIAQRELVILRACANCNAEYEWGVHAAIFATKAGFTQEQLAATCDREANGVWSSEQLVLIELVDELHESATISEGLWYRLSQLFTEEQIIELIMLAGLYHAVSFVVNGLRVQHETFAARFPQTTS